MAIILTRSHDRGVNPAPACRPGKDPLTTPPSGFCRIARTLALEPLADKFRALEAAGVRTVKSPAELGAAMSEQLRGRR